MLRPTDIDESSSSLTRKLGLTLLGVHFFWPERKAAFDRHNLRESANLHARILEVVREPMRRQPRGRLKYWDAMTFLARERLSEPLADSQEAELVNELILMLGANQLRHRTVLELINLPVLSNAAHARLAYDTGKHEVQSDLVVSRTDPSRIEYGSDGDLHVVGKGFYRLLEVDMDAVGMQSTVIDWERLLVLAVLLQIRCDLEIYYETGFKRVRQCEHRRCGAWFLANRMAGRQRFCSALCRTTEARDSGRRPTGRRRSIQ